MSVVASTIATQISGDASARERLDGWKEIAAHLRRTIRTAQRWERVEGLPVLRHQHPKGATVYAYRHEVEQWRAEGRTVVTKTWKEAEHSGLQGRR
jgi:hypothetical protein